MLIAERARDRVNRLIQRSLRQINDSNLILIRITTIAEVLKFCWLSSVAENRKWEGDRLEMTQKEQGIPYVAN